MKRGIQTEADALTIQSKRLDPYTVSLPDMTGQLECRHEDAVCPLFRHVLLGQAS